jgi:hypothetical protein
VVSLSGTISPSYCWEEVLEIPEIIQYVANRKIQSVSKDTNDPWQGFFQDEFGNHWSTVSCLADHIGIAYQTLTKILSDECDSLSNQSLRVNGLSHTGYCLEELLEIPEVKFYKETPRVAESGEWRGFYTDQDGNHWAPTSLISNRLDLGNRRVEDLIDDSQKAIHILSLRGWRDKAYCWESLLQLPVIDAYRHLPRVETEGEWKGFHIDQNGNHWGAIHTLASRLGLQFETMQQKLTLQTGLSTLQIRSLGGSYNSLLLGGNPESVIGETILIPSWWTLGGHTSVDSATIASLPGLNRPQGFLRQECERTLGSRPMSTLTTNLDRFINFIVKIGV